MSDSTALTTQSAHKALSTMTGGGIPSLIPQTIDEVYRFSQLLAMSGLVPKGIETPEQVTVQILMGFDLGLKPMQAVQNINVINGKPSVGGDLALAILMGSGLLEEHDEGIDGEGDARVAWCRVKRKGMKEIVRTFSVEDAKKAGLWDDRPMVRKRWFNKKERKWEEAARETPNDAPWYRYQPRMLCMRARGFAFRDRFSDALKGMHITEEMIGHEEDLHEPIAPPVSPPSPPPAREAIAAPVAPPAAPPVASVPAEPEKPAAPVEQEVAEAEIVDERPLAEQRGDPEEVGVDEPFDPEAWLDEVRDRFAEARTEADVDSVHETFGDTANEMLGMTERQRYADMHEAALKRTQVIEQPEAAEVTGEPGPAPIEDDEDDFPGKDSIQEPEPQKTPGDLYIERIRAAVADKTRTLESLHGLWTATKAERQQLVADGHLTRQQVKDLTADVKSRWPAETEEKPASTGPSAPPAKELSAGPSAPPGEQSDPALAYDATFRARVEACATVEEINALSPATLVERNKFSGHPLHKEWTAIVGQKRKQLTGIA